jgi:hypothetical protein
MAHELPVAATHAYVEELQRKLDRAAASKATLHAKYKHTRLLSGQLQATLRDIETTGTYFTTSLHASQVQKLQAV